MKRKLVAMALLALGMMAALAPAAAFAQGDSGLHVSVAGTAAANTSPGMVSLQTPGTYTAYDITGDGVADEIRLSWTGTRSLGAGYSSNAGLAVYVNGSKALDVDKDKFYEKSPDGNEVHLITLKNGKKYLHVRGKYVNALDLTNSIYSYGDGKFSVAYNLFKLMDSAANKAYASYGLRGPMVSGVSGNTIKLSCGATQSMIGCYSFATGLKYSGGKLAISPRTAKLQIQYSGVGAKSLKARRAIQAYKGKTGSRKAFTIRKGQKVVPKQVHVKNKAVRVKVKAGGRTGWIKMARKIQKVSYDQKTKSLRNKYFANVAAAG